MKIIIKNLKSTITIDAQAYYTSDVTAFGNGAKIGSKIEYIGKNALVIIPKSKKVKYHPPEKKIVTNYYLK